MRRHISNCASVSLIILVCFLTLLVAASQIGGVRLYEGVKPYQVGFCVLLNSVKALCHALHTFGLKYFYAERVPQTFLENIFSVIR